jgi:hypothetical protein
VNETGHFQPRWALTKDAVTSSHSCVAAWMASVPLPTMTEATV